MSVIEEINFGCFQINHKYTMNGNLDQLNEPQGVSSDKDDSSDIHQSEQSNPNDTNEFLCVMAQCANDVFKWLNYDELGEVNSTCKQLQQQTLKYFEYNSPREFIELTNDMQCQFYPRQNFVHQFHAQFRNVQIVPGPNTYNHLLNRNIKLHSLRFQKGEILERDTATIAKIVKNVKVIELVRIGFDGEMYETFLKHCNEMKHLIVDVDSVVQWNQRGTKNQWLLQIYPALEHVYWADGSLPENMDIFFMQNPKVRTFHAERHCAEDIVNFLMRTGISFDELHVDVKDPDDLTRMIPSLNTLHAKQQYKRLMVYMEEYYSTSASEQLNCIDGLCYLNYVERELSQSEPDNLNKIKILISIPKMTPVQAGKLARQLTNLEEIYFRISSSITLIPFICHARKLRKMFITLNERSMRQFDLILLNKKRMKLQGASKIEIYLPDKAYIRVKWESKILNWSMIEIKRNNYSLYHEEPFVVDSLRDIDLKISRYNLTNWKAVSNYRYSD